jgi:hypothetical protein
MEPDLTQLLALLEVLDLQFQLQEQLPIIPAVAVVVVGPQ